MSCRCTLHRLSWQSRRSPPLAGPHLKYGQSLIVGQAFVRLPYLIACWFIELYSNHPEKIHPMKLKKRIQRLKRIPVKNERLSLRISTETKDELWKLAKTKGKTITELIESWIEESRSG